MIIAWKSISTEAKLISGASCVSWRSRLGHYPKNLWWTSLISLERTLSHLRTYYVPLAQLTRIVILIQVVEKSCSMCTPNSMLKYMIVIILMASLFWKIPRLTLNFWWYSFIRYAKRAVEYWKTGIIIFRLKQSMGFASCFECEIRNRKNSFVEKEKNGIVLFVNLYNTRTI